MLKMQALRTYVHYIPIDDERKSKTSLGNSAAAYVCEKHFL